MGSHVNKRVGLASSPLLGLDGEVGVTFGNISKFNFHEDSVKKIGFIRTSKSTKVIQDIFGGLLPCFPCFIIR